MTMKKLILLAALCLASLAHAQTVAYKLRADVDPATATCGVYLNAAPKVVVNATSEPVSAQAPTGRVCEYSLATTPNGAYAAAMDATSAPNAAGKTATSARSAVLNFTLPIAAPVAPGVPQLPKLSEG